MSSCYWQTGKLGGRARARPQPGRYVFHKHSLRVKLCRADEAPEGVLVPQSLRPKAPLFPPTVLVEDGERGHARRQRKDLEASAAPKEEVRGPDGLPRRHYGDALLIVVREIA